MAGLGIRGTPALRPDPAYVPTGVKGVCLAEFPALPLWTDALIGDTYHLTPAQFGAYLRLLIVEWRTPDCSLPNDDVFLGRSIGDPKNWHRLKATVMAYFTLGEDGRYRQKRLLDERDYCSRLAARSSAGGQAKSLKRKNRDSAKRVPNECQNAAPIPTPIPKVSSKKDATPKGVTVIPDISLPDWLDREAWAGYLEMRQRIRAPMTARAKTLAITHLDKLRIVGDDPAQILDQSTQNSWKGLFALNPINSTGGHNGRTKPQSAHDKFFAGVAAYAAEQEPGSSQETANFDDVGPTGRSLLSS